MFTTQIEFRECCVWFQCITQWRCSCVSNAVAWWLIVKDSWLLVDVICVLLLLSSLLRLSSMSVMFDFNESLNDVTPVSPILLTFDSIQHKPVKQYLFWTVFWRCTVISNIPNSFFCMERCSSKDKHSQSSIRPRFALCQTSKKFDILFNECQTNRSDWCCVALSDRWWVSSNTVLLCFLSLQPWKSAIQHVLCCVPFHIQMHNI